MHSAAGGLGLAAVQVARALGAEVIATAGSEDKRRFLRDLGIRHVFDSRDLSWADGVRAATAGHGVDVVLNSLTGAAVRLGLDVLAEDGRFVEVGKTDVHGSRNLNLAPFRKSVTFAAVDLAGLMGRRPERFARILADAWRLVEDGRVEPLPVLPYTFADAAEALREMSHGEHVGKFVLIGPGTVTAVAPEPLPHGRLRADGDYLVTGGLGALGLSLAEFLADRGAGALALLGRSQPGPDAAARIARAPGRRHPGGDLRVRRGRPGGARPGHCAGCAPNCPRCAGWCTPPAYSTTPWCSTSGPGSSNGCWRPRSTAPATWTRPPRATRSTSSCCSPRPPPWSATPGRPPTRRPTPTWTRSPRPAGGAACRR